MSENSSELIAQLEKEGDIAADYLEGLLDIADLDGDLVVDVEGERALVSITGADLSNLVGSDGQVLNAIQDSVSYTHLTLPTKLL
jgi:spoIIIJ-associated protein